MSRIKTGLIFLLTGLAIYLASQLWFANTSSRNFFLTFFTRSESPGANNDGIFVRPYRFITIYGNNKFSVEYGGIGISKLRGTCDGIIQSLLKDGERLGTGTQALNYGSFLEVPGYMFEYAFNMPLDVFASAFGKSGFTDQLQYVTGVVFIPPDARRSTTIVWLLDEVNNKMSGFSVNSPLLPVTANPDEFQEVLYEASALKYDFIDRNTFIAQKKKSEYPYPSVGIVNPYAEDELLMSVIEKNVNVFFENPAAKLSFIGDNNVYTFVDANTVVKYYQNDVLEYSNYSTGDRAANLLQSFSAALGFIKSDALVINEYYLAGYARQDSGYTFYFDYVVNNFPLVLPDEYKRNDSQNGAATLNHAVEVTVQDGRVVNYKKIVYNFITAEAADKTANLDFEQVLAELMASGNQSKITDIVLGYKPERSKKAYLYWIIRLDGGQTFSIIG